MPISARTKGLSLDAVGTLIELSEPVEITYARFGRRLGIPVSEKALRAGFRKACKQGARSAPCQVGGEKAWWHHLVLSTFVEAGADEQTLRSTAFDALFEDMFAYYAGKDAWRLYPEIRRVLTRLSKRYPLAVASNFDDRLLAVLDGLEIADFFRAVIVSDQVGCRKPDRRVFEAAAAALDLDTTDLLHVGDDPECDWRGAAQAGCEVFRLDRSMVSLDSLT